MEGITILNEFTSTGAVSAPWFNIGIIVFIIGLIGLVICLTISKLPSLLSIILIIFFGANIIFGVGVGAFAPREEKINYQVLIDESTNIKEFIENYEIIDQDGLIYTIIERIK